MQRVQVHERADVTSVVCSVVLVRTTLDESLVHACVQRVHAQKHADVTSVVCSGTNMHRSMQYMYDIISVSRTVCTVYCV